MRAAEPKRIHCLILAGLCIALAAAGGCDGCRRTAGKIVVGEMLKSAKRIGERNSKVEGAVMEALRSNSAPAADAWQQFLGQWPGAVPHTSLRSHQEHSRFEGN